MGVLSWNLEPKETKKVLLVGLVKKGGCLQVRAPPAVRQAGLVSSFVLSSTLIQPSVQLDWPLEW